MLARADGVSVLISGDSHFADISQRTAREDDRTSVLVDVTSSGINRGYPESEPTANDRPVGGFYLDHNVGELQLTWPETGGPPDVRMRIYDAEGRVRLERQASDARDFAARE